MSAPPGCTRSAHTVSAVSTASTVGTPGSAPPGAPNTAQQRTTSPSPFSYRPTKGQCRAPLRERVSGRQPPRCKRFASKGGGREKSQPSQGSHPSGRRCFCCLCLPGSCARGGRRHAGRPSPWPETACEAGSAHTGKAMVVSAISNAAASLLSHTSRAQDPSSTRA